MDSPAAVLSTLHRQLYYPPFTGSCTIHPSAVAVLSTLQQQLYYPPFSSSCTIHPPAAVLSTLHQLYYPPFSSSCTIHPPPAVLCTLHQLYCAPFSSCTIHPPPAVLCIFHYTHWCVINFHKLSHLVFCSWRKPAQCCKLSKQFLQNVSPFVHCKCLHCQSSTSMTRCPAVLHALIGSVCRVRTYRIDLKYSGD